MDKKLVRKTGAVLLALIIWHLASIAVGMDMLLASPVKVIGRLLTIWKEPGFFSTVFYSLVRILCGFLIAFASGFLLAVAAGRYEAIETLLWPYIVTVKSVPVASFIILCLTWFSFDQLTVFIAFLIAFPVIYQNILQGIKSIDGKMLEMADIFKVSWLRRFLYIYLPGIKPYVLSASSTAVGMAWKAGVAAEVIGVVGGSIGEKLYDAKIYFMNADLLSWTIIIIVLSVLLEKLFIFVLRMLFSGLEKL
ncbi:MAG: ABC transporter permease subunit [Christensenellaceae bacterium]|nr:ABC transporter permease subunit [Christensenellaceae bacterium]